MNPIKNKLIHSSWALFLAGALYPLGFAPLNFWPLTLLSLAFFVFRLSVLSKNARSMRDVFWPGWWYGLGFFGMGVSWVYVSMHDYGFMPFYIAGPFTFLFVAFLATQYGFFAYFFHLFSFQKPILFTFPAFWVLFEWCRTWFLKGLPWLFSGYAFIDTPIKSIAPVLGVWGVSFVAALFSSALVIGYRTYYHKENPIEKKQATQAGWVVVAVMLIITALSPIEWTHPEPNKLKVSLVQGNVPQERKWLPEELEPTKKMYRDMTLKEWQDPAWKAEIVFLPEGALPFTAEREKDYLDDIVGIPTVIYHDAEKKNYTLYNSVLTLGEHSSIYHKQKLVAFGEFIPFDKQIRGLIPFLDMPFSSFSEGEANQSLIMHAKNQRIYTFAPFICYEIVYPSLVWQSAKEADFLLTNSNDAWFGRSFAAAQHFEMARMRALEHGKMLIRSTNSGITGMIDHKGKVINTLPSFTRETLRGEIAAVTGQTPLSQLGHWPILVISALLLTIQSGIAFIQNRSRLPKHD
jgi:apolipoprotein N-acyltransferase